MVNDIATANASKLSSTAATCPTASVTESSTTSTAQAFNSDSASSALLKDSKNNSISCSSSSSSSAVLKRSAANPTALKTNSRFLYKQENEENNLKKNQSNLIDLQKNSISNEDHKNLLNSITSVADKTNSAVALPSELSSDNLSWTFFEQVDTLDNQLRKIDETSPLPPPSQSSKILLNSEKQNLLAASVVNNSIASASPLSSSSQADIYDVNNLLTMHGLGSQETTSAIATSSKVTPTTATNHKKPHIQQQSYSSLQNNFDVQVNNRKSNGYAINGCIQNNEILSQTNPTALASTTTATALTLAATASPTTTADLNQLIAATQLQTATTFVFTSPTSTFKRKKQQQLLQQEEKQQTVYSSNNNNNNNSINGFKNDNNEDALNFYLNEDYCNTTSTTTASCNSKGSNNTLRQQQQQHCNNIINDTQTMISGSTGVIITNTVAHASSSSSSKVPPAATSSHHHFIIGNSGCPPNNNTTSGLNFAIRGVEDIVIAADKHYLATRTLPSITNNTKSSSSSSPFAPSQTKKTPKHYSYSGSGTVDLVGDTTKSNNYKTTTATSGVAGVNTLASLRPNKSSGSGNSTKATKRRRKMQTSSTASGASTATTTVKGCSSSSIVDDIEMHLGLMGWRKKCLYTLLVLLMLLIVINLGLTLWILKVMEFSTEGMGQLKIVPGGIQLHGQAIIMDTLRATSIRSRHGQPISIESSRNFSINTRDANGLLESHLFLGHDKLECIATSFRINDTTGRNLFSVDRNEVTIGAHSLRIEGEGGAIFRESIQTPHVRAEPGRELRLESPTRQLEMTAAKDINLQSRAGGIDISALEDVKLTALDGSLRFETTKIFMPNLRTAPSPLPGAAPSREHLHRVFQLCACANGKLFLAAPHSICAGDDTTVCR